MACAGGICTDARGQWVEVDLSKGHLFSVTHYLYRHSPHPSRVPVLNTSPPAGCALENAVELQTGLCKAAMIVTHGSRSMCARTTTPWPTHRTCSSARARLRATANFVAGFGCCAQATIRPARLVTVRPPGDVELHPSTHSLHPGQVNCSVSPLSVDAFFLLPSACTSLASNFLANFARKDANSDGHDAVVKHRSRATAIHVRGDVTGQAAL